MKRIILTVAVVIMFVITNLFAKWENTNGPFGSKLDKIIKTNDAIIVFNNDFGFFKSTNNGKTWLNKNIGIENVKINCITYFDSTIFLGTNSGILSSTNNGDDWIRDDILSDHRYIINYFHQNNNSLFATTSKGFFILNKNSTNWELFLDNPLFHLFALNDEYLFFSSYEGIYKYDFEKYTKFIGNSMTTGAGCVVIGSRIIAATNGGIFTNRFTFGAWTKSNVGLTSLRIKCIINNESLVFIGTDDGAYVSDNVAISWKSIGDNLPEKDIFCLELNSDTLFVGLLSGIYYSFDLGKNWHKVESDIFKIKKLILEKHGDELIAGSKDLGVYKYDIMTHKWENASNGLSDYSINDFASNDSITFAATKLGLYLKMKNDNLWQKFSEYQMTSSLNCVYVKDSMVVVGWVHGRIYVYNLNTKGSFWIPNIITSHAKDIILNNDGIYLLHENNEVTFTSNFGNTWKEVKLGFDVPLTRLHLLDSTIFIGTNGLGILRSNNKGETWFTSNDGLRGININSFADFGEYIFCGTENGVFYSSDEGYNWIEITENLESKDINDLFIIYPFIYLSSSNNTVYKANLTEFGIAHIQENIDSKIYIHPNPATDFITIQYSNQGLQPFAERDKVQIFDVLGVEVMFVGSGLDLSTQQIDVSHLSAGVYFIRIGDKVEKFVKF